MSIRDTSAQDRTLSPAPVSRRRRRPLMVAIGSVAVAVAATTFLAWGGSTRAVDGERVRIAEVTRGDLIRDIFVEGRVISANSPTLYSIAGGTVTLHVVAGDVVKRGQTLAEVDSPELRSRLAQEDATLASLESEVSGAGLDAELMRVNARKLLDQATVDHVAAQREIERNQRAFERGAVAQIDLARANDALRKAELSKQAANREFQLQLRRVNLDTRNKRLLAERQRAIVEELRRQVDALMLRAPFDGQVGQVMVPQRANVAANAAVLSIVDLSVFEVEYKVPESFARDLAVGVPAEVRGNSGTFPASISAVSPEVVGGEVAARLRFKNAQPPGLRQNQRLSARIVLDTRHDVLMVERGPFVEQGGGHYAYVMEGNTAVRHPIRTGESSLSAVEILDGVKQGDRIVVSGSDQFGDAQRIRINAQ